MKIGLTVRNQGKKSKTKDNITDYSYWDRRIVSPAKPKFDNSCSPDCAIFYTNLHELFCQFISWTNWVNSGKFMDNCWTISCQVMAYMKNVCIDLIIINL